MSRGKPGDEPLLSGDLRVGVRVAWFDSSGDGSAPQTGVIVPFADLLERYPALANDIHLGITGVLPDGAPRPIPVSTAALSLAEESR